MKQYFKNLMTAFCGRNPFQEELDGVKKDYAKCSGNVESLKGSILSLSREMERDEKRMVELAGRLSESEKNAASLQRLVENLRARVAEKDAELDRQGKDYASRIDRMKSDYQKRINEYNIAVDELKKELSEKGRQLERYMQKRQQNKEKR